MTTRRPLTDQQEKLLDFLLRQNPAGFSQRELTRAAGFDHPQSVASALAGLFVKGYLVVAPDLIEEQK